MLHATPLVLLLATSVALAQIPCYDTAPGTALPLTNDSFSPPLPLGFGFDYGGVTYTECQVCSNGYVVLGSGPPGFADWSPTVNELLIRPIPRICPLWKDLDPGAGGVVAYEAVPAAGADPARFTITWRDVPVRGTSFVNTCQLVLIDGGAMQLHHDANAANGAGLWVIGASPGNGAPSNWVSFAALPFDTGALATLHDAGLAGPTFGRSTMRWTPNGLGGFTVDAAPGCASLEDYGQGCGETFRSAYEHFPTASTFDLANTSLTGLFTGASYVMTAGQATFVAPSPAATSLGLTDDSVAPVPLPAPFPYPGGTTTTLEVNSNGFVLAGLTGNILGTYDPNVGTMLGWPFAGWASWRDYEPTPANNVLVETVNGVVVITWDAVPSFNTTFPNTFQLQFDLGSGAFHVVWQGMDTTGGVAFADDYLVGFSPGGGATDPGNADLSPVAAGLATIATAVQDIRPLDLMASAAPILGTQIGLVTTNLAQSAPFGALLLGLTRHDPGLPLAAFGMPGCFQYNDQLAVLPFLPGGAAAVTTTITVPNAPGFAMQAQSAAYAPFSGLTPLGAVSSDAVELRIGR